MTATSVPHPPSHGADVAAWLQSGAAFGGRGPVERIDTHAASIFLHGDRAWKIKRPVSLGYLDFSTAAKRRAALEAELTLNRRTAADLYIAVHAVTRTAAGKLILDGEGIALDWVLEMHRFPDDALLDHAIEQHAVDDVILSRLADAIVVFHSEAAVNDTADGAERLRAVIDGNARAMARYPAILPPDRVAALQRALFAAMRDATPLLAERGRAGRVRHCHGDLHLANIAIIDGTATPFDCLEFDTELATSDVLYDLAFLLMDLCERGQPRAANIVYNRYMDRSPADEAGVGLIRLFMAVRASVRAHVLAAQAEAGPREARTRQRAGHYLAFAGQLVEPQTPRLVAIGGLSGTGKSTLARSLGGVVGGPPGARILRSDVLRKRLAGIDPEMRLPAGSYTQAASDSVYDEIDRLAGAALAQGQGVIADAMFAQPAERRAIASVAAKAGCAFDGLWLQAATEERVKRVEARPLDASDADAAVARAQGAMRICPPDDWSTLEATGTSGLLRAAAVIALNLNVVEGSD